MGWDFRKGATKADVIAEIRAGWSRTTCLKSKLVGSTLWALNETRPEGEGPPERWIGCHLLRSERGFGWGEKSMGAEEHPYYYSCPLGYLDEAPSHGGMEDAWRVGVRAYHERAARVAKVKVGDVVKLVEGARPSEVTITAVAGRKLLGTGPDGRTYRVARRLLA